MSKSVSVIIPCRNEEMFIGRCIESFINQTYPKELYNIIIADGMSDDKTRLVINKYIRENSNVNILVIDNEGLTAPKGMNKAIEYSTSDIIIIFGAHAEAEENFIMENVNALEDNDVGCSGGILNTINDSTKGKAIAQSMMCPFGVGNATFRYSTKEEYVDTVAFGAYRRAELIEIGKFDEELVRNQDDELNFRVINSGKKILLSPKIISTYYARDSIKKLWKQYYQYGFWKVRVIQKHKRPASLRHLIPALFSSFVVFGILLSLFSMISRIVFLSILGLYLAIDLIVSIKISLKNSFSYFRYLIIIFPILHLSYGFGFIMGIKNFYIIKSKKLTDKNTKLSR